MGLTRLRRLLRDMPDSYHDVQSLLDAADRVLENAEVSLEDRLKDDQYPESDDMAHFVEKEVERLVLAVARIESVGMAGVLRVLVEQYTHEHVAEELEHCKPGDSFLDDDALGDLDEHPF